MADPIRKIIGIDFGSTQSSVATMDIGSSKPPELLNIDSDKNCFTIPTQLALDTKDDSVVAWGNGVLAKFREKWNKNDRLKFVSNFKRYLGADANDLENLKDDEKDAVTNAAHYTTLFLKELAKGICRRLNVKKLDAEKYATCIGYPAGWSDTRVAALKRCAIEAGFPAEEATNNIGVVREPIAAMHALYVVDELKFKFGPTAEHYLVVDFGGGTLDVCVVEIGIHGKPMKILSTAGDPQLGGKDFDDIIATLFFKQNAPAEKRIPNQNCAVFRNKIREAKESCARSFKNGNPSLTQSFQLRHGQYLLEVTKDEIDTICRGNYIYEKFNNSIKDALSKAKIDISKIRKVVLTGGSSKWWFVRELIMKTFSISDANIYETQNPFTDVAIGCATAIGYSEKTVDKKVNKKGEWVSFLLDGGAKFSEPKLVFNPYRNAVASEENVYLCELKGSKQLSPYKIKLCFQTGNEEKELDNSKSEYAVVEYYARSNNPWFRKIFNLGYVLQGKAVAEINDKYDVYLRATEDDRGVLQWKLVVMDFNAVERERVRINDGDKKADNFPDGKTEEIAVIPGEIAYRGFFGLRTLKHKAIEQSKISGEKTQATSRI